MLTLQKSTLTWASASLLSFFILIGCSSQSDSNLPLIERNAEVKEYFELLDTLVIEYCDMVEDMVEGAAAIEAKEDNGEEATFADGLALFTSMGTSAFKIAKLAKEVEALEKKHPHFEDDLTAKDFEEFMGIYTKMIQRFYDLGKKMEEHEKNK